MDPTSHQTSSFEMPSTAPRGELATAVPERASMSEGAPASKAPAAPAPMTPPPPIDPSLYAVPSPGQPITQATPSSPAIADDIDLIEKEWVEKAKAIVAQTRNDPHSQNNQMNRFKADYMKKRYNKDIKLPEGP